MIDRNVEKTLQLVLVKIESQHPVRSGRDDHVCHELCADGDSWLVLSVLSRLAVIRHDACDASSRRSFGRVDEEQKLHDVFGRRVSRLQDENVITADVFVYPDEDLAVSEPAYRRLGLVDSEIACNLLRKSRVPGSDEEFQAVTRYG